jgi:hypothetical protein
MGFYSRRPHRDPLLSDKNKKLLFQWTRDQQHWTIEEQKNIAWSESDESWFLLRHVDGRVRIWGKQHESMAPSCLVSTVQAAAGLMVLGHESMAPSCLVSKVQAAVFLTHVRSLHANESMFERYSVSEHCC